MEIVPTKLIRISRYYMATAIVYLLITLGLGITRVFWPIPSSLHWAPAVLGWMSFPIMGAYYQFFPTLQGQDLRFERLSLPQYVLANLGLIGMMAGAWSGNQAAMAIGTIVYAVSALAFVAIILGNTNLAKLNLTLRFYLASLTYFAAAIVLLLLATAGTGVAWATRPFLLHVIAFGWAVLAIMGAEYSMVPMLQLKELRHPRLAEVQFVIINLGFWGLAGSMAIQNLALTALAGVFTMLGIGVFAYIIVASLRSGPNRLPHLDTSVKFFVVGIAYLMITALVGTLMAAFRLFTLTPIHLHLGLIGVVTMTIVGAMYHIVPFVVWWEVYAPKLGIEDVPLLNQLYSRRNATWQLYGLNAGLLLMVAGFASHLTILLALGGTVITVTALAFAREMLKVLGHRRMLGTAASATNSVCGGIA